MTTTPFAQAVQPIPRDRWSRPLVTPADGGKPIPYTRCTTMAKCIDDTTNLTNWKLRLAALGLLARPDLQMAVASVDDPESKEGKKSLNATIEEALEAAGVSAKATLGTAIHKLTEIIDRGEEPRNVPLAYIPDLVAYREATAGLEVLAIEEFVVQDELHVGGTLDRRVRYQGRDYIADVKTGSIDLAAITIAAQLATYARSVRYDHTTNTREPLNVDLERALIIHLPAGTGTCRLVWVDIAKGWEAMKTAKQVHLLRSAKNLTWPLVDQTPAPDHTAEEEHAVTVEAALFNAITVAPTADDLTKLWQDNQTIWASLHTEAAKVRKQQLAA